MTKDATRITEYNDIYGKLWIKTHLRFARSTFFLADLESEESQRLLSQDYSSEDSDGDPLPI